MSNWRENKILSVKHNVSLKTGEATRPVSQPLPEWMIPGHSTAPLPLPRWYFSTVKCHINIRCQLINLSSHGTWWRLTSCWNTDGSVAGPLVQSTYMMQFKHCVTSYILSFLNFSEGFTAKTLLVKAAAAQLDFFIRLRAEGISRIDGKGKPFLTGCSTAWFRSPVFWGVCWRWVIAWVLGCWHEVSSWLLKTNKVKSLSAPLVTLWLSSGTIRLVLLTRQDLMLLLPQHDCSYISLMVLPLTIPLLHF